MTRCGGAVATGYRRRVHTGSAAIGRRIARLVLLACTLFGLAAMHTIGHGAVDHAGHHREPSAAVTLALFAIDDVAPSASHDCVADGCGQAAARHGSGGHGMGIAELCVAVLGALAVAVLLAALLLTMITGRSPPRAPRCQERKASRAPPVLPFGLTLAAVSVLRT